MWEESELVLAFPFAHGECHLFGEDIREPLLGLLGLFSLPTLLSIPVT